MRWPRFSASRTQCPPPRYWLSDNEGTIYCTTLPLVGTTEKGLSNQPRQRHRRAMKTMRALRREFQQKQLIRGLCVGMTTRAIAKQLKLTPQTIRDWIALPEVQGALAEYEREHFDALDRRFRYSMNLTMEEFVRQLKRRNWKAVERMLADTGILGRLMEHYLAKMVGSSPLPSQPSRDGMPGLIPMDDMSDEHRESSRQLMRSFRKSQNTRRMIAPGMTTPPEAEA